MGTPVRTTALASKSTPYDVTAYLQSAEDRAAYLDAWLNEAPDDASGLIQALGNLARAVGMAQVSRDSGLNRETLYRTLSERGNPSFTTMVKVLSRSPFRVGSPHGCSVGWTSYSFPRGRVQCDQRPLTHPTRGGFTARSVVCPGLRCVAGYDLGRRLAPRAIVPITPE